LKERIRLAVKKKIAKLTEDNKQRDGDVASLDGHVSDAQFAFNIQNQVSTEHQLTVSADVWVTALYISEAVAKEDGILKAGQNVMRNEADETECANYISHCNQCSERDSKEVMNNQEKAHRPAQTLNERI